MCKEQIFGAIALGIFFLAGFACSPEIELEIRQGEFVRYESTSSLQVCEGTYKRIDNFVPFVAGQLQLEVDRVQTYRWLDADDFEESDCPEWSDGCARGRLAASLQPFLPHELVHTVLTTAGYPYQPFFSEGIAEALDPWSGDGLGAIYLVPFVGMDGLGDPRPAMTGDVQDFPYVVARSFVMFLLARHGSANFLEFTQGLGSSRNINVIEREFKAAYGVELDVEAELFMSGAPYAEQSFGPAVYDCTSPDVPWVGAQWSLSGVMDCASEDVAGGFGPEEAWPSIRSVTLEVPTSGRYDFRVNSDGEFDVQIGPCSRYPWQQGGAAVYDSEPVNVELTAGTHFVRMRAMSDESPSFDIVLSPEVPGI